MSEDISTAAADATSINNNQCTPLSGAVPTSSSSPRGSNSRRARKKKKNKSLSQNTPTPQFIGKLYRILETCDPSIASWTEDGETFTIKNEKVFASNIIPLYFDHNNFKSFARQLNFYNFRKIASARRHIRKPPAVPKDDEQSNYVVYYHNLFKRGRTDLLSKIQRSTNGTSSGKVTNKHDVEEVQRLKGQIKMLESTIEKITLEFETKLNTIEVRFEKKIESLLEKDDQQMLLRCSSCGNIFSDVIDNDVSLKVNEPSSPTNHSSNQPNESTKGMTAVVSSSNAPKNDVPPARPTMLDHDTTTDKRPTDYSSLSQADDSCHFFGDSLHHALDSPIDEFMNTELPRLGNLKDDDFFN
mmetsp:Transcript_19861/g.24511  ORF Transcript_19861/g.24511 Transcript_19861/m.24511 type:complete len:357 (-) Transcript_19861:96-1166(-)|eukprot:CAMPEP_0172487854 /NCGR_PEP_ID=MMETSP1066-20121228/17115_1 /TAXON_ID=671091 /ORGANISM="Coscinodiscus wailesii, Strain CCMP2513" /LENGTH=356 /DNA_ID=CAMNT_0013254717 /DNA_START=92 /DNA_END=1162 /DNA_ORIENTATION=+